MKIILYINSQVTDVVDFTMPNFSGEFEERTELRTDHVKYQAEKLKSKWAKKIAGNRWEIILYAEPTPVTDFVSFLAELNKTA